jgi:hypothetical protein
LEETVNCKDIERLSARDPTFELSPKPSAQLKSHLASCDACRRFADGMTETRGVIESWREADPPKDLMAEVRRNVLARISKENQGLSFRERWIWLFRVPRAHIIGSAAAAALMVAASWLIRSRLQSGHIPARSEPVAIASKPAPALHSRQPEDGAAYQPEKRLTPPGARAGIRSIRPASSMPPSAYRIGVAEAAPSRTRQPAPVLRRIELQTADPNIRIIWLFPEKSKSPPPEVPRGS